MTSNSFVTLFLIPLFVAVIAALIVPGIRSWIARVWQNSPPRRWWGRRLAEDEARRLLVAFRERSGGNLNATLSIEKAARQAYVDNPAPALALLSERGLIIITSAGTTSHYIRLIAKGLAATENPY